jgi:gamma-glutamyl:cysteine ligase YbdK (ATP-grasp superfamily)
MRKFLDLFRFDPQKTLYVGVERECFLLDQSGAVAPLAAQVLNKLPNDGRFGYELSACQLEERIGPSQIDDVHRRLLENDAIIRAVEKEVGCRRLHAEVGPEDMPLDMYPDPSGRYARITENMPRNVLLAACRVAGTHVHIGMPNHATALKAYNRVIESCYDLCQKGDGSFGERLEIYRVIAPDYDPPKYESWKAFYETALQKGFDKDPRRCWTLIRISVHGTLEFRMFGVTSSLDRVVSWAKLCHVLCAEAMP